MSDGVGDDGRLIGGARWRAAQGWQEGEVALWLGSKTQGGCKAALGGRRAWGWGGCWGQGIGQGRIGG